MYFTHGRPRHPVQPSLTQLKQMPPPPPPLPSSSESTPTSAPHEYKPPLPLFEATASSIDDSFKRSGKYDEIRWRLVKQIEEHGLFEEIVKKGNVEAENHLRMIPGSKNSPDVVRKHLQGWGKRYEDRLKGLVEDFMSDPRIAEEIRTEG
ncbi:unnamed protein product, partial [Mesorhabditis spiculigera]